MSMASTSRKKTTMAKLARERTVRERRELKQAKKAARKRSTDAARLLPQTEPTEPEPHDEGSGATSP
jgi:hypothetical protein